MHTHIYIYVYLHIYICIHTYIIHTYIHTYIHVYISTYVRRYIHTHTYTHTYIHTCTLTYRHVYAHSHTHTHTQRSVPVTSSCSKPSVIQFIPRCHAADHGPQSAHLFLLLRQFGSCGCLATDSDQSCKYKQACCEDRTTYQAVEMYTETEAK